MGSVDVDGVDVVAMLREERRVEMSSDAEDVGPIALDELGVTIASSCNPGSGLSSPLENVCSDSNRATAAATPSNTARNRSGRSNMCEALGCRMYLCCKHAGWMNRPRGERMGAVEADIVRLCCAVGVCGWILWYYG